MSIPEFLAAKMATYDFVCGSDECGLGSWAGPLIVCAAVTPRTWTDPRVTDSKALTPKSREALAPWLRSSFPHCIIRVDSEELDRVGVGVALLDAHSRAIQGALEQHRLLDSPPVPLVIIDGNRGVPGATPLPKADSLIPAVSVASIIGKVHHDHIMQELHAQFPGYGFGTNQGYGTKAHRNALHTLGVSPAHRKSYSPMSEMLSHQKGTDGTLPSVLALIEELDTQ
jgi:ribonuclease HII